MTNKKYNRVVKLLECHPGPQTVKAVLEQIPESIWARCASKDIAAAANAINRAYHAGRESTGAEILDSSPTEALVWVAPLNKAVSITA
jgi:hypothetical protein